MEQGIKIRLYPNKEQTIQFNKLLGCYRVVYNQCLDKAIRMYKEEKKSPTLKNMSYYFHNELTKDEKFEWLREQNTKVLKEAMRNLLMAYKNFFTRHKGFPKFKSKKEYKQRCRFPLEAISTKNDYSTRKLSLANIHNIKFRCSKKYIQYLTENKENIRVASLTKTSCGNFYLSIRIDGDLRKTLPQTNNCVGIDLGIKNFIVTSEGEVFDNLHFKKSQNNRIKRLQKNLSKKQKGSKNRNKARIKYAKKYERITNVKRNYLHSVSNQLLNDNQVIVMEDLNVNGMMKNHKLAESIQEMNFGEFKSILIYKALWYGRHIEFIDRFYPSSKTCHNCGSVYHSLKMNEREWTCEVCGHHHNRDMNAAQNILDEGLKKIVGCRTTEFTSMENPTMDDIVGNNALKSSGSLK